MRTKSHYCPEVPLKRKRRRRRRRRYRSSTMRPTLLLTGGKNLAAFFFHGWRKRMAWHLGLACSDEN